MVAKQDDDPRGRLSRFAAQLRELSFPTSPILIDDANYFADAIERFLTDAEPSMDRALGLTPGPGRPPDPKITERAIQLARDVLQELWRGASVTDSKGPGLAPAAQDGAITIVAQRTQLSEGTVRAAYYQHRYAVLKAELLARLDRFDCCQATGKTVAG